MKKHPSFFCFVALCLLALTSQSIFSQETWKTFRPSGDRSSPFVHAIMIPAIAEYKKQPHKAYVILRGNSLNKRSKLPAMGVVLLDVERYVPATELAQFEGDLDETVIREKAFEILLTTGNETIKFASPTVLSWQDIPNEPASQTGDNFFTTNMQPNIQNNQEWRNFLAHMSAGFEQGQITLGGKLLSAPIVVQFRGKEIESALPELMKALGN